MTRLERQPGQPNQRAGLEGLLAPKLPFHDITPCRLLWPSVEDFIDYAAQSRPGT